MSDTNAPPTSTRGERPWRRRSPLWARESQIRQLSDAGWSAAQIRKLLGLRVSAGRLRQFLRGNRAAAAHTLAPEPTALTDVLQAWRQHGRDATTTPSEFGAAWLAALPLVIRRQISRASHADLARLARMLAEAYPAVLADEWRVLLRSPARAARRRADKELPVPAVPAVLAGALPPADGERPAGSNPISRALDEAEARQPNIARFFERKE